jgi:large subunit ribosomal protein L24
MRIRGNDNVLVIKGRDRGKRGLVQQILVGEEKVVVEGVNVVKRHTKATGRVRQTGIIQKELPVPVSNVALVCTHCDRPTRVAFRFLADGTKARICKKCGEVIE